MIETIAEALEMEPEAVIETLRAEEGTTLAYVIEANGGDVDAIVATLVEEKTERINEAVEDGRLTQEEADDRISELEERITERLNGELTRRGPENGLRDPRGDDAPMLNHLILLTHNIPFLVHSPAFASPGIRWFLFGTGTLVLL